MSIMAVKAYRRDHDKPPSKQSPKYHDGHENKYRRMTDRNYGPETQEKGPYQNNMEMSQDPKQGPHNEHRGNNKQNYPSNDARANNPRTFIGGDYPLDTPSSVENFPLKYPPHQERKVESYQDHHIRQPQSDVMMRTPRGKTPAESKDQNNAQFSHNSETDLSKGYNAPEPYYNSDMRYESAEADYRDREHSSHIDPSLESKRPKSYSHSPKIYSEEYPLNEKSERYNLKENEQKYNSKPQPGGTKVENGREGSGQYYKPQQASYHGSQFDETPVEVEDRRPYSRPSAEYPDYQRENINYRDVRPHDSSHKSREGDTRQNLPQVPQNNQFYSQHDSNTPQKYPSEHNRPSTESMSNNNKKPLHQERDGNPMRVVESKKDMQPSPSEAESNLSEEHDGFLDMGAYTDKKGSFGWYADFPVGKEHDKVTYSFS